METNTKKKATVIMNYIVAIVILLSSIMLVLWIWAPRVLGGMLHVFMNPSRVVGLNLPVTSIIPLLISLFVLILALFARSRKRGKSLLYWVNGLSMSIIISHLIMLSIAFTQ